MGFEELWWVGISVCDEWVWNYSPYNPDRVSKGKKDKTKVTKSVNRKAFQRPEITKKLQ